MQNFLHGISQSKLKWKMIIKCVQYKTTKVCSEGAGAVNFYWESSFLSLAYELLFDIFANLLAWFWQKILCMTSY